jgi:hypothetical protein
MELQNLMSGESQILFILYDFNKHIYVKDYFMAWQAHSCCQYYIIYIRCKCGNCSLEFLSNWQECNCCCELDGCQESLSSEIVQQDLGDEDNIVCVTQHPGFRPVCLEKWSLRMAAWTYKTKGKQRYKQLAGEER